MSASRASDIERMCVLDHAVRRALYDYVAAQEHPVGRDAAAAALSVTRRLAAFHLDQLVDAGLLVASFRRLSGRHGPGAGRPAKLYARADVELDVTVPPREYALAGDVLAETVSVLGDAGARALAEVAGRTGERLARSAAGREPIELLAGLGYDPYDDGDAVRLRNCPFHRLAERHRDTVCGANLHLLRGALGAAYDAVLAPAPGRCCVELRPAP